MKRIAIIVTGVATVAASYSIYIPPSGVGEATKQSGSHTRSVAAVKTEAISKSGTVPAKIGVANETSAPQSSELVEMVDRGLA